MKRASTTGESDRLTQGVAPNVKGSVVVRALKDETALPLED